MEVLVLVLRPRVLVLVLTKKSYLHHCLNLRYSPYSPKPPTACVHRWRFKDSARSMAFCYTMWQQSPAAPRLLLCPRSLSGGMSRVSTQNCTLHGGVLCPSIDNVFNSYLSATTVDCIYSSPIIEVNV